MYSQCKKKNKKYVVYFKENKVQDNYKYVLFRDIIVVCSENDIHHFKKHVGKMQNYLNVKPGLYIISENEYQGCPWG
jgi:hypothetical protein